MPHQVSEQCCDYFLWNYQQMKMYQLPLYTQELERGCWQATASWRRRASTAGDSFALTWHMASRGC